MTEECDRCGRKAPLALLEGRPLCERCIAGYWEVFNHFKRHPLVPGETDEDRARRAGGRVFPPAVPPRPE